MEHPHQQKVNIKTANFFDVVKTNWPLIFFGFTIVFAMLNSYFKQSVIEDKVQENTADIKLLNQRVSNVEGDIKAIREGVDYIRNELQNQ